MHVHCYCYQNYYHYHYYYHYYYHYHNYYCIITIVIIIIIIIIIKQHCKCDACHHPSKAFVFIFKVPSWGVLLLTKPEYSVPSIRRVTKFLCIFAFCGSLSPWIVTCDWNASSWNTMTYLSYTVNMMVDACVARIWVTIILTKCSWNIWV